MFLPVHVKHKSSNDEVLVYALLDSMSDTSFITNQIINKLDVSGINVNLSLSTLSSSNEIVSSTKVSGIQVRGYNNKNFVSLSALFSRDSIPANRDHIPTYEKVNNWSHLRFLKYKLAPELQCPVGLIIGYDNVNVLALLFTTPALNFGPYGQLTSVGWGVVRCTESVSYCKGNQVSYCAFSDCGISADHNFAFCFKTSINHEFTLWDMSPILEQDFTHSKNEDEVAHFLEDLRFLRILEKGIEPPNGVNYSMPLPFKSCDKPVVPNNRVTALNCLDNLRYRFLKDAQYFEKYSACIDKLLENEHAERVPFSDLNMTNTVWFLPHHGVFQPRKPDKLRVVFIQALSFKVHA